MANEVRTGFTARNVKVYFRQLKVLETYQPFKDLALQVSQRGKLYIERSLAMETEGVGVMGATDRMGLQ